MTVQGPVKTQQPDGMSHRGGGGAWQSATAPGTPLLALCYVAFPCLACQLACNVASSVRKGVHQMDRYGDGGRNGPCQRVGHALLGSDTRLQLCPGPPWLINPHKGDTGKGQGCSNAQPTTTTTTPHDRSRSSPSGGFCWGLHGLVQQDGAAGGGTAKYEPLCMFGRTLRHGGRGQTHTHKAAASASGAGFGVPSAAWRVVMLGSDGDGTLRAHRVPSSTAAGHNRAPSSNPCTTMRPGLFFFFDGTAPQVLVTSDDGTVQYLKLLAPEDTAHLTILPGHHRLLVASKALQFMVRGLVACRPTRPGMERGFFDTT